MANSDCLPQVQACAIRVAVLASNGQTAPGASNLYVTDSLTQLQLTPVYEDGEEVTVKNACGGIAVNYKGDDSFKRADIEVTIVQQDPYLTAMLGGGSVLTSGGLHGYAFPAIGTLTGNGISLEVWAKRIDNGALHDEYPYAWWVLPRVNNLRLGQRTFTNGAQLPVFSGQALENDNWGDGPLNDWPVASNRVAQWFPTDELPDIACGVQESLAS